MLRRVKADVELGVPPKREVLVYAPSSSKQQEMYKAICDRTIRKMVGEEEEVLFFCIKELFTNVFTKGFNGNFSLRN